MEFIGKPLFSDDFSKMNMKITEAAQISLDSSWKHSQAGAPFNRIYAVMSGKGYIEYSGKKTELLPGNIYFIPAGLDFGYGCDDTLEKLYFHINLLGSDYYDMFSVLGECIILRNKQKTIDELKNALQKQSGLKIIALKALIGSIVCEVEDIAKIDLCENIIFSDTVNRAIGYIKANLRSGLSAKEIAEKLYISESLLRKQFYSDIGISVGKYINNRLFHLAEMQVRTTDIPIERISEELGFCDRFYFSRMFCQRFGMPPARYRRFYSGYYLSKQ